jgi:NADH-quinone oxidoreductase subunit N
MNSLLYLSGLGVLLLLTSLTSFKKSFFWIALFGLVGLIGVNVYDWLFACHCETNAATYINGMLVFDGFSYSFFISTTVFTILIALMIGQKSGTDMPLAETLTLLIFSLFGAYLMVSSTHLAMLFLGIETLSIPLYILAAAKKRDLSSNEAALKYFILGAFASGFLLFGIALVYGATGSFSYQGIQQALLQNLSSVSPLLYAGMLLILVGLGFKVGLVPFHFWTPDVYQGSPTAITAFMASVVKTAAIAALYRLFSTSFMPLEFSWLKLIALMAGVTIAFGNLAALIQKDVKRLFAYSSIAHAGYLALALLVPSARSASALFLYTTAYGFASIVSFASIAAVERTEGTLLSSWSGLWKRAPFLAACSAIAFLSLAGLPPFAGFFAKFYLFTAVLNPRTLFLVGWALVFSLVGLSYYLKLTSIAMLGDAQNQQPIVLSRNEKWAIGLATAGTIILGLFPSLIIRFI